MNPLTPIRRSRNPVAFPDGRIEPNAGVWRLPWADVNGSPGEFVTYRPGGWRSALALAQLLLAVATCR